jgi:N-acetylmuramoyl-L-alanine amidase
MQDNAGARRRVLRLLASCAVLGWVVVPASAQPSVSAPIVARPQRKPVPPVPLAIVVIDPGHGGIDPGAIGPSGIYEKDIVYPTARDLARQLGTTHHFRVFLTRRSDEFVPLRERVRRARALHADLFLSIHADELPNAGLHGLSVFTLSAKASDREAEALAVSENKDIMAGVNLSHEPRVVGTILADLARRQTDNLSLAFARGVVAALGHEVPLLENPQRSADFAVLTAPDIPSALVELGCMSNPAEEDLLQQQPYQRRLAHGLALAIEAYFAARFSG